MVPAVPANKGHTGGRAAETVRQPQGRLRGQLQRVSIAPPLGGTRDRLPPARGAVSASGIEAGMAETRSGWVHESPAQKKTPTAEKD